MRQLMPVGYDDFQTLRQENLYFVDKTYFIKELAETAGQVKLITRPRRFGKTLNLSMLRYFYSIEQAAENRKLFAGTLIEQADGGHYMARQGTHPVVFLTLKDLRGQTWEEFAAALPLELSGLFHSFASLQESKALTEWQKEQFRQILRMPVLAQCQQALQFLTQCLHSHYGKKVVLLLDEYDAPIQAAWSHGYYEQCIHFMRNFLSKALKTNQDLAWAVLTGVTRVSKESIFSGLNNLRVYSVLEEPLATCFGFTQAEVERIAADCGAAGKLPELRAWYDGYRFGTQDIYNPFSVISYFSDPCRPKTYWMNTSGNSILRFLLDKATPEQYEAVRRLMEGGSVLGTILEGTVYGDLGQDESALATMMVTTGYLKPRPQAAELEGTDQYELVIPNEEVGRVYAREILAHIRREWPVFSPESQRAIRQGLLQGEPGKLLDALRHILKGMASYHDKQASRRHEGFYHGVVLGLIGILFSDYEVRSNRESGQGRYDIALFPRPLSRFQVGVLLELKEARKREDLALLAREAWQQMQEKEYRREFGERGIQTVWQYGIAFAGEEVCVADGADNFGQGDDCRLPKPEEGKFFA